MKTTAIIKLLYLGLLVSSQSKFTDFAKFVNVNFRPSETIRRNCAWQYAIIKVKINAGIITHYNIEDSVSKDLAREFKFLNGYVFKNDLKNKSTSVVFMISLENSRTDACDVPPVNKHEPAENVFNKYKLSHKKTDPSNIYINEIMYNIIYDPSY